MDWTPFLIAFVGALAGIITAIVNAVSGYKDRKEKEKLDKSKEIVKEVKEELVKRFEEINAEVHKRFNEMDEKTNGLLIKFETAQHSDAEFKERVNFRDETIKQSIDKLNETVDKIIDWNCDRERAYLTETHNKVMAHGYCPRELKYLYRDRFLKYKEAGYNHVIDSWLDDIMNTPDESLELSHEN